ncbi:MAG: hypothetical protein RBS51_00220 [Anaerovoracaceae bacterium]|jgi:hypothetical protein|nr:hypothetical protein [Anaerovoracaceae bacterium]
MKKIITIIGIIIVVVGLLGSCGFFLNPRETSIKDDIYDEYETMMDAFVEVKSIADVSDYLLFRAQTLGVQGHKDRSQSVIIETVGTNYSEEGPPLTIECGFSLDNLAEDLRAVAISLVIIKEIDGAHPLRIIFTPYEEENYFGAAKIPASYLKDVEMIHLNTRYPNEVVNQGASSKFAYIERKVKMKTPSYKIAYRITIDGFNEELAGLDFSNTPNAIRELGVLFATCKSKGMLFEIVDFSGGGIRKFSPISGSAIMVINQNDMKSLEYYYGKMESRLIKAYQEEHPDIFVTMAAIETPTSVLSNEDTDRLVSFIYTIFNGFCGESDFAFSTLNMVATTNAKFSCSLLVLHLYNPEPIEENDDLDVICNLNDMDFRLKDINQGWYQDPESGFLKSFLENIDKKPKGSFYDSPLVEYQRRNNNTEMLSYGVDLKDCEKQFSILKKYIESRSPLQLPIQTL